MRRDHSNAGAQPGHVGEGKILFDARLGHPSQRLPAPVRGEMPTCASDVGSRGLKMGLSIPTISLVVFPIEIDGSRSQTEHGIETDAAGIEIHREGAAYGSAKEGLRPMVFQPDDGLAQGGVAGLGRG